MADQIERILALLGDDLERRAGVSGRARSRSSPSSLTASAARARPGADRRGRVGAGGAVGQLERGAVWKLEVHGRRCYASTRGARPDGAEPSHSICRDVTVPGSAGAPARVLCPAVDATALRSQFPVFEERAYLNSGTCGPLPRRALHAVADGSPRAAVEGRTREYLRDAAHARAIASGAYA